MQQDDLFIGTLTVREHLNFQVSDIYLWSAICGTHFGLTSAVALEKKLISCTKNAWILTIVDKKIVHFQNKKTDFKIFEIKDL